MTAPKTRNPDAITRSEAAQLLGVTERVVRRHRRDGLLGTLDGYPSYSRREVEAIANDPWLSGTEAAAVLGVSRARVSQLAKAEKIPSLVGLTGRRYFRKGPLSTTANARRARRDGFSVG